MEMYDSGKIYTLLNSHRILLNQLLEQDMARDIDSTLTETYAVTLQADLTGQQEASDMTNAFWQTYAKPYIAANDEWLNTNKHLLDELTEYESGVFRDVWFNQVRGWWHSLIAWATPRLEEGVLDLVRAEGLDPDEIYRAAVGVHETVKELGSTFQPYVGWGVGNEDLEN